MENVLNKDMIKEILTRREFYLDSGNLHFTKEIIKKLKIPRTSFFEYVSRKYHNIPTPYHCDYFPKVISDNMNNVILMIRERYGLQYSRYNSLRVRSLQQTTEYSVPYYSNNVSYSIGGDVSVNQSTSEDFTQTAFVDLPPIKNSRESSTTPKTKTIPIFQGVKIVPNNG